MPGTSNATRSSIASVSAGIAVANAHLPKLEEPGPRFPGEDGGHSLAEIAHRDLDAALQLLAERAQYITGASGAAIALRRGQHSDMLCRASAGSNAPELGALLSMEYGLSGESVRTRQALRCDDAERDPRVNREGCRQLGIASVVIMPIVTEQQVLGVFELFSGKPRAFEERDVSALQRLSEMVETAVKHAVATPIVPEVEDQVEDPPLAESQPTQDPVVAAPEPQKTPLEKTAQEITQTNPEPKPAAAPKKPLFWSAALQTQASAGKTEEAAPSISVPPVLRNLQKCQACGFPVSQGRTFCVECEEKKWKGQRLPKAAAAAAVTTPQNFVSAPIEMAASAAQIPVVPSPAIVDPLPSFPGLENSEMFSSSAAPSQSWFAANKYVLGALLVVAVVISAIAWLR